MDDGSFHQILDHFIIPGYFSILQPPSLSVTKWVLAARYLQYVDSGIKQPSRCMVMLMKPPAIFVLAALPLFMGCYTTPGYYGGSYGYVSGPPYDIGYGYAGVYTHHYHRHDGVRLHKHPIYKGRSPRHRFHRPDLNPRSHFDRTTGRHRGSHYYRFKQPSLKRDHYRGSGQRSNRGHLGTRQKFRGNHIGTGRNFGRGTSFGRGFRR